eukprot:4588803-Ditylum_brightwellii.AAC.1
MAKYRALHFCSALGSLPQKVLFSELLNTRETLSSLPKKKQEEQHHQQHQQHHQQQKQQQH